MNNEQFRKMIGEKVARLRKKAKLSQSALGKRLGVGQSMISQIEVGSRGIPEDWLQGLARALEVNESELLPESLAPSPKADEPGSYVADLASVEKWRTRVLMDASLHRDTALILVLLAAPEFLNRRSWMVLTTVEQFARVTGRSRELIDAHWQDVIASPYIERVGEVEWNFWLRFPV